MIGIDLPKLFINFKYSPMNPLTSPLTLLPPSLSSSFIQRPYSFLTNEKLDQSGSVFINDKSFKILHVIPVLFSKHVSMKSLSIAFSNIHLRSSSSVLRFIKATGFKSEESFYRYGFSGLIYNNMVVEKSAYLILLVEFDSFIKVNELY